MNLLSALTDLNLIAAIRAEQEYVAESTARLALFQEEVDRRLNAQRPDPGVNRHRTSVATNSGQWWKHNDDPDSMPCMIVGVTVDHIVSFVFPSEEMNDRLVVHKRSLSYFLATYHLAPAP